MASTSLGTLTLDLAVRLSEFTDGLSRAERATTDTTEEMGDSVSKFKEKLIESLDGTAVGDAVGSLNEKLSSITEAFGDNGLAGVAAIGAASVIGSVAAIGAGLVTLALQTAETDEQLERLATRAKTSTTNLQVLTAATGAYGLEMESVGDILADAQEKLGEFSANGGGGLVDTLELMQNATKKTDAELEIFGKSLSTMDSVDAIQAVVNEMEQAGATSQEVRFVTESLASGLGDIIPLWDNNGEALRNYEHDLNEAGVIRTKESIEQSQILANEVEGLQIKFEGVSNQLVTAALPAMGTLIEYFKEGTTQGGSFKNEISGVGQAINITAASVVSLAAGMGLLINSFSAVGMQMRNIGQTAQNFYAADTLADKGKALFTGFFSAGALASGSMLDISSQWARDMETINKLLDGASSKMERVNTQRPAVNTSFGSVLTAKGNNAAFPYRNDGIPYRTGAVDVEIIASRAIADAAEKEAKAQEKAAKANDKKTASIKKQAEAQARLVAITGDTGVGRAHLDVRYARGDARYGQEISAADVARFQANGKALTNYPMTSGFGKRNTGIKGASTFHLGNDYATPIGTKITTKVAVTDVKTWYDKNGGGYVSTVEFADGVKINLLHQSPESKGIKGGSSGSKDAYSGANDQAQQLLAKHQADVLRQQEELERARLSISQRYATDKEKIERDHTKNVTEIERLYTEGSDDRAKYLAREKERYEIEKNAGLQSISEKYFSEEQRIHDAHKKAMAVIDQQFAENDPSRQLYVDLQNKAYQEDLANFKFAAGAKAREQDKLYQSIANSAKANSALALSTGLDNIMQREMSGQDYESWRLNQDYVEGFDSINNGYKDRAAEINAVDDRGQYSLPELERFELLEIAKQEHLDRMWALEQEYALKDQTLAEQQTSQKIAMYQSLFSGIAGLTKSFAGEQSTAYRIMFGIEQGFAIAQAAMAIQQSIAKAMTIGYPQNIPIIAETVGQGAQIVSNIKNITMGGIAHGGLDYVPKEATYLLDEGERVLSPRQNKDLANFMANGSSRSQNKVTVNNYSNEKADVQTTPDGDTIVTIGKIVGQMVDGKLSKFERDLYRQGRPLHGMR